MTRDSSSNATLDARAIASPRASFDESVDARARSECPTHRRANGPNVRLIVRKFRPSPNAPNVRKSSLVARCRTRAINALSMRYQCARARRRRRTRYNDHSRTVSPY